MMTDSNKLTDLISNHSEELGLCASKKCIAFIRFLCEQEGMLDPVELWISFKATGYTISIASVYRVVGRLSEKGYAKRVFDNTRQKYLYELLPEAPDETYRET